jgi:hypothetical protein
MVVVVVVVVVVAVVVVVVVVVIVVVVVLHSKVACHCQPEQLSWPLVEPLARFRWPSVLRYNLPVFLRRIPIRTPIRIQKF